MRSHLRAAAAAALAIVSTACSDRSAVAFGDLNSIIVVAPDSLWVEVEDEVREALEPTILAVREERTFDVTHVAPTDPTWTDLRKFRQLLLIGRPDDAWVRPVVEKSDAEATPGHVIETKDIWARGQIVDALLLPEQGQAEAVRAVVPELREFFDRRLRSRVRQRMYASGVDSALVDTLRAQAGFSLVLPNVYQWTRREDGVYRFLNAQPKGGQEVIRSIVVASREGTAEPTAEALLEWRREVGTAVYDPNQTVSETFQTRQVEDYAGPAVEVIGTWSSVGSWPMGGVYVDRMVVCPAQNRSYLLDTYLFAPGEDKYEYVLQLMNILDSFACAGG